MRTSHTLLTALLALSPIAVAQEGAVLNKSDKYPEGTTGTESPESALKKFSVAPGLRVDLWASEPLFENPVAFSFDEKGRAFIAETFRRRTSTLDIRKHMDWLLDVLALRTVEERAEFLKKALSTPQLAAKHSIKDLSGDGIADSRDLAVESERVKVVTDTDGDGKGDTAKVFAEGFKEAVTGIGAGVLARGGEAFYTCIPDVWRIAADGTKTKLASGFGVHVAYGGHDMHGIKMGPDGRLYWTIADCGAHATSVDGKVVDQPDCGAVFRCEPDGTGFELVMRGLRNPQSLAFNDVGDLFTGDNNADGGDKARWVHVAEGGDAGWRIGWQFLPKLGPWNSEKLWELDTDKTALSQLPPVGHIGHGPAGIAYYPGTGLPDSYREHFFYADFPGGVRDFALKPRGASYTVDNPGGVLMDNAQKNMTSKLLWGLYPSDVQFGVDGGAYVLDWVYGWDKTGKGRIFRVHDPVVDKSAAVLETKKLLADGMTQRSVEELSKLLGHVDQRVRVNAQFELVRRGDATPLAQATLTSNPLLMRLHGIWGVSQLARKNAAAADKLMPLAMDKEPEVRAQWAKFVGDAKVVGEKDLLVKLLADPAPRVRFFAAQSLGKIGDAKSLEPLVAMLRENANADAYLRHAGAVALASLADAKSVAKLGSDKSEAVRTASLLALGRRGDAGIAKFLTDSNPLLVREAARAIHDEPIADAWPALAALAEKSIDDPAIAARAINANYLIGSTATAERLGKIATNAKQKPAERIAAIESLGAWNEPFKRDRVIGLWRKLPPRSEAKGAREVIAANLAALVKQPDEAIRVAAIDAAASLKATATADALLAAASDSAASGKVRAASLRALGAIDSPKLADAVKLALSSTDKEVLEAARKLAAKVSPADAVTLNAAVLGTGSVREQQEALATIGEQAIPAADEVLAAQLDALLAGKIRPSLQLDLLEAAATRSSDAVKQKLAAFEAKREATDPLGRWRECLEGGDAKLGREIFTEKAEAACMRCHKVKGEGGDVGPDLAGIGKKHDRAYILTSIVDPNAAIAPGFENVMLSLNNGGLAAGIVSAENATEITLTQLGDGSKVKVKKADVKQRDKVPSAMPPGLGEILGKRDLRNVVEFLATLK